MNDETAIAIYTGGDQGATSYVAAVAREWLNARPVSWATFNQRRSILSSFFMYALRNEVEHIQANPIERIKARKPGEKAAAAQALHPGAIKTALAAISARPSGRARSATCVSATWDQAKCIRRAIRLLSICRTKKG